MAVQLRGVDHSGHEGFACGPGGSDEYGWPRQQQEQLDPLEQRQQTDGEALPHGKEPKASRQRGGKIAVLIHGAKLGKSTYEHLAEEGIDQEDGASAPCTEQVAGVPIDARRQHGTRIGKSAYEHLAEEGVDKEDRASAPCADEAAPSRLREGAPIDTRRHPVNCFITALTLNAAMGGFLFGYDTGVVSGAMLEIRTAAQGLGDLSPVEQEVIVSSTIGGAIVGSLLSGEAQKRFWMGRRSAILLGSVLFTVGALFMGVSWGVASLSLGRVVVGLAVGVVSQAVPLYISECAPAALRGSLNALNNVFIVLGQVVASLVCCVFARRGTPQGWRWMLGLGALPAVLMCAGFSSMPESPRYVLLSGGGGDEALREAEAILTRLRGRDDAEGLGEELQSMVLSLREEGRAAAGLSQVLRSRGVRRALLLGCSLQLLQQLCGVNTLMYYSATILQMSGAQAGAACGGATPAEPTAAPGAIAGAYEICMTALIALSQLLGTVVGMALVDRSGRRPLIMASLAGVAVSLFVLGAAFHPGGLRMEGAPIWAMVVYLVSFGVGMAPLPWTVNAEIYPLQARSTCLGLATATNWAANFLVAATFLDLAEALSTDRACPQAHPDGAFWLYGLFALAGLLALAIWMPETSGLTLEETAALFETAPAKRGPPEDAQAVASPTAVGSPGLAG